MAMKDRALITTGAVGAMLAAICCAAPLLAVVLGAFGLTAWLDKAAYAAIPALLVCLGLVAYRFNRRARASCASASDDSAKVSAEHEISVETGDKQHQHYR